VQRSALVTAGVALLCVVAVAFAAAAVSEPRATEGAAGNGTGEGAALPQPNPTDLGPSPDLPGWLSQVVLALVVAALLAAVVTSVGNPRETLQVLATLFCLVALAWGLSKLVGDPAGVPDAGGGLGLPTAGSGSPGGAASGLPSPPAPLLLAAFAAGAVLLVALLARYYRGDDEGVGTAEAGADADTAERAAALGAIAGETADRIEGTAGEGTGNEVYRAWREMTGQLEVSSPETSTPAEFADAAVGAGMAREHVAELTELFRSVRYGGAEPTVDREERAVRVLRQIEDAYTEE
jgi:hypothetical protein